jgi:hypothetical protein
MGHPKMMYGNEALVQIVYAEWKQFGNYPLSVIIFPIEGD